MIVLYWSILALFLGGCVGSFCNVVIYRWSRDLSVRRPLRSFCPSCSATITWYDNLPVISYFVLGGRCRHCGVHISRQYPLVEAATALVFLIIYYGLFAAPQRYGLTDVTTDWAMLLAHWALFAGMIVLVAMDLEAYIVDIRVTGLITMVGLVAHTLWRPAPYTPTEWIRPNARQAGFAIAVTLGLIIASIIWPRQDEEEADQLADEPADDGEEQGGAVATADGDEEGDAEKAETDAEPIAPPVAVNRLWVLLPILVIVGYLVTMVWLGQQSLPWRQRMLPLESGEPDPWYSRLDPSVILLLGGLLVTYLGLAIAAAHPQPEADAEIAEAIDEEAPDSRGYALGELKFLAPAILLGGLALFGLGQPVGERILAGLERLLAWEPVSCWYPIRGLCTALVGWVIGGAIGWLIRIFFTLLLGKEALGMGDVHLLAAAGAVAGWPVAFIGFFLAACLALPAMIIIRIRRPSRTLPFGPWLALAFLVATIFQDRILELLGVRRSFD